MPTFFTLNPYVSCVYFAVVLIFSMTFMHPVFAAINLLLSFIAALTLSRKQTMASFKYTVSFGLLIAFINPLFNTGGDTVLFTYFSRNYTLQSLIYGFIMASILVSCINWFACFGKVITTDKFMYMMGGRLPNVSTVLTMVISLIPFFQNKLVEITQIQKTVLPDRKPSQNAFRALSVAASYAFEHAVNLSFSMKNRGYGSGKTTHYAKYTLETADKAVFTVYSLLTLGVAAFAMPCAVNIEIIPAVILPEINFKEYTGILCYILLLLMPVIITILEEIQWQYLKSKI